ncbi:MAG TPA: MFS transporter [Candidatus Limnocylindrales bacterium]|nr:MFS transporter [Candidatus Limnocylindrales bacterium]
MTAYLRLLRNAVFGRLWLGATVSIFGDALTFVSLVWLTTELGGGAAEIGILAACLTAPVIAGGLAAGVLLDRFDRRRLLMADNLVRGLAVLSVPIAAWAGVLDQLQLYVVAAVYGLLYMVSLAGFPSVIPDIVDEDDLPTANALESLAFGLGGVVGPTAAGLLIAVIGAANNLFIDALTYFFFVAILAGVRLPARVPSSAVAGDRRESVGLGPALRFVRRTPAVLAITLMFMAFNVGEGMLTVLLPIFARDTLGLDAAGYGALVSAFTAGTLVGAVVVGAVRWRWTLGRSIAAAQLAAGVAIIGLAAAPPFVGAVAVLVVVGLFASPLTIWAQTVRMRLIPEALRGRVFSLLRTLMRSTPPAGGLLAGGLLAAGLAIGPVVALLAAVVAVPGAVALVHPALAPDSTGDRRPGPAEDEGFRAA